jgi:hypothetical protein
VFVFRQGSTLPIFFRLSPPLYQFFLSSTPPISFMSAFSSYLFAHLSRSLVSSPSLSPPPPCSIGCLHGGLAPPRIYSILRILPRSSLFCNPVGSPHYLEKYSLYPTVGFWAIAAIRWCCLLGK